jgi:hypothetical protein
MRQHQLQRKFMADRNSYSFRHRLRNCRLWLCAACVALGGCASTPVGPDAVAAGAEPDRAIVIGWGNTAGEKARAALTPAQGTRVTSLYVAKANAQKSGFGENIARLSPGDYELTIACGIYIENRFFSNETEISVALRASRVYRLRAEPSGRRCQPALEDVTDNNK